MRMRRVAGRITVERAIKTEADKEQNKKERASTGLPMSKCFSTDLTGGRVPPRYVPKNRLKLSRE